MSLKLFKLEDYLSEREFKASYMFCASDLETHSMAQILDMADSEGRDLWSNLKLNYTEPYGNPILRKEISKQYQPALTPEDLICFAGAEEGIYCMSHALLDASAHVIVIAPCYQSLETIPASICEVTKVNLMSSEHWRLDLERVSSSIRVNTRLIIINFPHNPTGTTISAQLQNELIELCRAHNIWIFSDEVYRLLEIDAVDRLPAIVSKYEKGLSLGVMSKAYGLAGLRIGWIGCRDTALLNKMSNIKHYLSICNSAPSEVLALIALRSSEQILARNLSLMRRNILLLDNFFDEYSTLFEWTRPKGGCVGFPRFKGSYLIDDLAENLMAETGVLILPGSVFDIDRNHFRIGFGRDNMTEALTHFKEFISRDLKKSFER